MNYVIDTSVDIKTYVQEEDSAKAVRLRIEYHQGVHDLIHVNRLVIALQLRGKHHRSTHPAFAPRWIVWSRQCRQQRRIEAA